MRPFKLNITPKLTEKQRENRLRIARHHEDWSAEGWRRVLWSEEPSFEFHDPPNHNRRVRAVSSSRCASRLQNEASHQKARPGMTFHRAMSQCQWFLRMSQKTVINGEYYRTDIFAEGYLDAINRKAQNGVFSALADGRHKPRCFRAGRSSAAYSPEVAALVSGEPPGFWRRAVWPENSPDLNPTENLWLILQDKVNKMAPATTADELVKQLKRVWRNIQPCAGEPGGGNAVSEAWLHRQHWRPHWGIHGKTKHRVFFIYGVHRVRLIMRHPVATRLAGSGPRRARSTHRALVDAECRRLKVVCRLQTNSHYILLG